MKEDFKGQHAVEDIGRMSLLYDFYGGLLTEKQREVMGLYHEENLSLAEIGDEFGISRQAVHNTLKAAELALRGYEEKLGLAERLMESRKAIAKIDEAMVKAVGMTADPETVKILEEVKTIIDRLED